MTTPAPKIQPMTPVTEGFTAFSRLIKESFIPMAISTHAPSTFWSKIRSAEVEHVQVSDIAASRHVAVRRQDQIGPASEGYLKVNLQLAGTGLLVQDDREAMLHPGDLAVYDTQRPFSLTFEDDSRSLVLMFQKDSLGLSSDVVRALTAMPINGRVGVGNLVVPFLFQLANNLEQLQSPIGSRLIHNVTDLMSTVLSSAVDDLGIERNRSQRLFQQIADYIDLHLSDVALSPTQIADAHFVSTRHLQGLFQVQGTTVSTWIRERRLGKCARDLHDQTLASRSINAISTRWGFPDAAHFSRIFKEHSGLTPTEFRAVADARTM